jgi:hypothetical protein
MMMLSPGMAGNVNRRKRGWIEIDRREGDDVSTRGARCHRIDVY